MNSFNRSILLTLVFLTSHYHFPSTGSSTAPGVQIDWVNNIITSYGNSSVKQDRSGVPLDPVTGNKISLNRARIIAYTQSKEKAVIQLINGMLGINVEPGRSLKDIIDENTSSRYRITELIEKKVKINNYPLNFTTSGSRLKFPLSNIISIIPYDYPNRDLPEIHNNAISTVYTGLIIDARNLGIEPVILPSIINEDGLEIYGKYFIDPVYALRYGMVSYEYNEQQAMKNRKAGRHPYFAVALKNMNGSPVLSFRDIKKILSSPETRQNLKKCRVIILVDRVK